jgi:CDP-diacylglycerol---serine O-phosphatidyltransferase
MKVKNQIPNILTTFNLVSGLLSITLIISGNFVLGSAFIFVAALFDFLDGTAARLLKAHSAIGKELDSLADLVSFGVAPGIIMFQLISFQCVSSGNILERYNIAPYFALLIPVCSAIRLAKFNIDPRQEEAFIGLPTPANAIFFASIPLVSLLQPGLFSMIRLDFLPAFFENPRVMVILTVMFSYLLVSEFRIFSMKFKTMDWQGNRVRYILLITSLILLFLFSISAIPMIIITYLLLSLLFQKQL